MVGNSSKALTSDNKPISLRKGAPSLGATMQAAIGISPKTNGQDLNNMLAAGVQPSNLLNGARKITDSVKQGSQSAH